VDGIVELLGLHVERFQLGEAVEQGRDGAQQAAAGEVKVDEVGEPFLQGQYYLFVLI